MNKEAIKHLNQLDHFCKSHKNIYIYGAGRIQDDLRAYLNQKGIHVNGRIVSDEYYKNDEDATPLSKMNIIEDFGAIITLSDRHYNDIFRCIQMYQLDMNDFFVLPAMVRECIRIRPHREGKAKSLNEYLSFYQYICSCCKAEYLNLFCCEHLGDTIILLGLKDALERKYKCKVNYIISSQQRFLADAYGITEISVVEFDGYFKDSETKGFSIMELEDLRSSISKFIFSTLPQKTQPFVCAPIEWNRLCDEDWKTIVFGRARMLDLREERIYPPTEELVPSENLVNEVKKYGGWDKVVLVAPEARANPQVPFDYWVNIVNKLIKEGFTIVCNTMKKENRLEGTLDWNLSVSDLIALGQRCHEIHSTRSGLCDCLAARGGALHVYYTNDLEREFEYYSLNNNFYLDDPVTEVMVND